MQRSLVAMLALALLAVPGHADGRDDLLAKFVRGLQKASYSQVRETLADTVVEMDIINPNNPRKLDTKTGVHRAYRAKKDTLFLFYRGNADGLPFAQIVAINGKIGRPRAIGGDTYEWKGDVGTGRVTLKKRGGKWEIVTVWVPVP